MRASIQSVRFWGLAMRLLAMPLACHYDLLSYFGAAHQVVYHGTFPFAGQSLGTFYSQFPTAYLTIGWLWLIKPLIGVDPWPHDWFPGGDVYQINDAAWFTFVSLPSIGWILFLLKLPFLLGEWAMIRSLVGLAAPGDAQRRVRRFLWLNPVSIFVLYVFGSPEIFVLGLLAWSLACVARRRLVAGALLLGCSTVFRLFPLLFVPLFAALTGAPRQRRWQLGLWAALPFALWLALGVLRDPGFLAFLASYPSANFLLSFSWPIAHADRLYPFVVAYVVILCVMRSRPATPLAWVDAQLIILLAYFSTSFFHPQYFIWLVPFLAVRVGVTPRLQPLVALQVLCYGAYTFSWGRPLAGFLFAPLRPEWFMALPSPADALAPLVPIEKLMGLAHSVLAGASLWMAYSIARRSGRRVTREHS